MKQEPHQKRILHSIHISAWIVLLLASSHISAATIPHGTVTFHTEDQWIMPGHQFYTGLLFRLEEGWHIYWINPGDSGEPPRIQWHLPPGFAAAEIQWPAPRRIGQFTIVDFGYEGTTTLIVPIHAATSLKPNQQALIGLVLDVLVCREICIPGKAQLSISLPIKLTPPEPDGRTRDLFTGARKALPQISPRDWAVSAIDAHDVFILKGNVGRKINHAVFFPLNESQVDNSAPQLLKPIVGGFRLSIRKSDQLVKPIQRLRGVVELSPNESYIIDTQIRTSGPAELMK